MTKRTEPGSWFHLNIELDKYQDDPTPQNHANYIQAFNEYQTQRRKQTRINIERYFHCTGYTQPGDHQ